MSDIEWLFRGNPDFEKYTQQFRELCSKIGTKVKKADYQIELTSNSAGVLVAYARTARFEGQPGRPFEGVKCFLDFLGSDNASEVKLPFDINLTEGPIRRVVQEAWKEFKLPEITDAERFTVDDHGIVAEMIKGAHMLKVPENTRWGIRWMYWFYPPSDYKEVLDAHNKRKSEDAAAAAAAAASRNAEEFSFDDMIGAD